MAKDQSTVNFSDEEINDFLMKYVQEYRILAEKLNPEQKRQLRLFMDYPFKIIVSIDEKGTTIEYQFNAKNLEIEISRVNERPRPQMKPGYFSESYANIYLKRLIDQPELKARRDIENFIAFDEHLKEEQERAEDEWAAYEREKFDEVIQGYANSNKRAYSIQEETFSNKETELYHIIQIFYNQSIVLESYLFAACLTLFDTLEQTMSDLESSAFLAVHGKYEPAMGLLRRYLDTVLCSLYYDSELLKLAINKGVAHREFLEFSAKKERWLETSFPMRFSGHESVLSKLFEGDTDRIAKSVDIPNLSGSYQKSVERVYYDLSKYVHYGGKKGDITFGIFQTYNEEKFKKWNVSFHEVIEICNLLILLKYPKFAEIYNSVKERRSGEVDFLTAKKILDVRIAQFNVSAGVWF